MPFELATCSATRSSSFAFHSFSALGLRCTSSCSDFTRSSERTRAKSSAWLMGLRQEVVGAGLDALDALALRVERGDEDDRQQRGRGIGAKVPAHVVAGQAGHHHVEQDEVRRLRRDLGERLLAVDGGRHRVALHAEQVGEELDVVRRVVDHQHFGRRRHVGVPSTVFFTASRNSLRLIGLPM